MLSSIEKTTKEFAPLLKEMEAVRKKSLLAKKKSIFYIIIAITIVIIVYMELIANNYIILLLAFFFFLFSYLYYRENKNYAHFKLHTKRGLTKALIKEYNPKYTYLPKVSLEQSTYMRAINNNLFTKKVGHWNGEDLVRGKLANNWNFAFSEINVDEDKSRKDNKSTHLFYKIKMPHNFKQKFHYNPNSNSNLKHFLNLKKSITSLKKTTQIPLKKRTLQHESNSYDVYTENESLLKRIINKDVLKYIDSLNSKFKNKGMIEFSLVDNNFFLIIQFTKDFLEIDIKEPIRIGIIKNLITEIKLLFDPIDNLIPLLKIAVDDIKKTPLDGEDDEEDSDNDLYQHLILK